MRGSRRRRRAALAALLAGTAVLGTLPPAMGSAAPSTVVRRVPVETPRFAPRAAGMPRTAPLQACAPMESTMVGLVWTQGDDEVVTVDLRWGDGDSFGEPLRLLADPDHGPDPGSEEAEGVSQGTDAVWVDGARCVRFRLAAPHGTSIDEVEAVFVDTSGSTDGLLGSVTAALGNAWGVLAGTWLGFSPAPAEAVAPQPGIVTREQWGADERLRRCGPDYADALKMAYVHHTAGSNSYTKAQADDVVRGIYAYHTQGRGFCDIAYNFLVDRFGRVYEGRYGGMTEPVIGAHAMGFNTGSAGVSAMGNFTSADPPRRMLRAIKRVMAWRLDVAHLDPMGTARMTSGGGSNTKYDAGETVTLPVISGHRDTGYTTCPGDRLFSKLKQIRRAARRIGTPKIWNPTQSRQEVQHGTNEVRVRADLSEPLAWTVSVQNDVGGEVRSFAGQGSAVDVTWDGTAGGGVPVPDGDYRIRISGETAEGKPARPAELSVRVRAACTLIAPAGGGVLEGTAGDDVLCGGPGNDTLIGGDGNDTLLGADGDDTLRGQAGSDVLIGGPGDDAIQGNGGRDTAGFQGASNGVTVDLEAGTAQGDGSDTLLGMDDVTGSPHDDRITGNDLPNRLSGGGGSDFVRGLAGDDRVFGGPGADIVVGGRGVDVMRGGGGADRLRARDRSADLVVGGPGVDLARVDALDVVKRVEQVR